MKKLTDYKNEDAIELWADLIGPMARILGDEKTKHLVNTKSPLEIAKGILENHKAEAVEIMLRIDDTPIDGLNIITRLAGIVLEIMNSEELRGFFGSAGQEQTESASFGSATANIKVIEKV